MPPRARREPTLVARLEKAVPWLYVALGFALGYLVPTLHGPLARIPGRLERDQVIAFFSAVSTGMMAFTAIVFSMFFILLQFGSTAYSPHLVTLLARRPVLRHAAGVFTGTFLYSLMALRGVGALGGATSAITVWTTFLWLLASVYVLMRLVAVVSTFTIGEVLEMLGAIGHRALDRFHARPAQPEQGTPGASQQPVSGPIRSITHMGAPCFVLDVDFDALVKVAKSSDALIRLMVGRGDSVTAGKVLATVQGPRAANVRERDLCHAIELGADRAGEHGPNYAMRMLVDIGIRALSPAINDPTTAVHALDHLEALLVRLGNADLGADVVRDEAGVVRVLCSETTWEDYLDLGLVEIQQYGAGSVQVERRLAALLQFLAANVPASRCEAVVRLAVEHAERVRASFPPGPPRARADAVDRQGLGHTGTNGG